MDATAAPAAPLTAEPARPRARLRGRCVAISRLDDDTVGAAWELFASAYAGADRGRFEADLAAKQRVLLLRDPATGALGGFSTIAVRDLGDAEVVFSGDTVVDRPYWGTKALQRAFSAFLVRRKLRHPTRPLYWFLISKGYKTYLMLAHACPHAIPRGDRPDDPALRAILDRVASDRFGDAYDVATGLIRHATPLEAVRPGLTPIDDRLAAEPHVAFFLARNPGHARGDELACLAEIRLADPVRQITRTALGRRPR